ncbi:MAG: TilS substrate-binding domain-containing protein, partial [Propionibacteriaceae bacterium]|nr:TilS substrate-binding domain-containing protein [Propionibacteriaceae bacterium]
AEAAAAAAAAAEALGLKAAVRRVAVTAGGGVEAAARQARYGALLDDPEALTLVGHTLDDQAETVLLGLARGSGTRSLAGMPECAGRLLRPFRGRRRQTEQACRDWGLAPWADPMNADPAYTRVRARRALATLEQALGPGLAEALARTAALCAEDADLLDALAADAARGAASDNSGLPVTRLAALPAALRGRVLMAWLRSAGAADLSLAHRRAVEALVLDWRGQVGADVPGGRVVRAGGQLRFEPPPGV